MQQRARRAAAGRLQGAGRVARRGRRAIPTAVRQLLFALMLLGLLMSSALPRAFEDRGLVFALVVTAIPSMRRVESANH